MKKTKKLELHKETVRKLLGYELKLVVGGSPLRIDTPITETCPPCGSDDDCDGGRL